VILPKDHRLEPQLPQCRAPRALPHPSRLQVFYGACFVGPFCDCRRVSGWRCRVRSSGLACAAACWAPCARGGASDPPAGCAIRDVHAGGEATCVLQVACTLTHSPRTGAAQVLMHGLGDAGAQLLNAAACRSASLCHPPSHLR